MPFRLLFIHPSKIVAMEWSPGTKVSLPQIPILIHLEPLGSFGALLGTRIQSCNIGSKFRYEISNNSYRTPDWSRTMISWGVQGMKYVEVTENSYWWITAWKEKSFEAGSICFPSFIQEWQAKAGRTLYMDLFVHCRRRWYLTFKATRVTLNQSTVWRAICHGLTH